LRGLPSYARACYDFAIFSGLADRLGFGEAFTEGLSTEQWLERLYQVSRDNAAAAGVTLSDFASFFTGPPVDLRPQLPEGVHVLERFRADPEKNPLDTPSARSRSFRKRSRTSVCGLHRSPRLVRKARVARQCARAERFPLHLLSNQPRTRLHSQLDYGVTSQECNGEAPCSRRRRPR
jgi:biotin/methionine sulfoxide reductase